MTLRLGASSVCGRWESKVVVWDGRRRVIKSMIASLEGWLWCDVESIIACWSVRIIKSSIVACSGIVIECR